MSAADSEKINSLQAKNLEISPRHVSRTPETDEPVVKSINAKDEEKRRRKEEAKLMKMQRKAKREGKLSKTKKCTLCTRNVKLLIRCQIDTSRKWNMVCGKCWNKVSGGVVDGDAAHPNYRYGGIWKSK
eukprot:CAMPEP_0184488530 /NCGR_PEP_ID=MMETSP0113_2-20130426/12349_1 /TAXON_ID=91329 /ORGANISM="Norrisiella sphaerica, Strain BC52" /LENGTH=128 /DNA_ID=CAMNT_0026871377 /DNA_START=125 /DNA_END=511 /DNA_ORIENTATION=+